VKKNLLFCFISVLVGIQACRQNITTLEILKKTIDSIDTIETIIYKQDMRRTNPQNPNDTIFRYREMHFKRLVSDSIVGVKGHWYMYINDKENVIYEDIFDGNRLIRKNNKDSVARIYDLGKFPDFRKKHFWGHNTVYGMQYEFKYILANSNLYSISSKSDTTMNGQACYQIVIGMTDKMTMPGFSTRLEDNKGSISKTTYIIDKENYYPIGMKGESYSSINSGSKMFMEQLYYDIQINHDIDEHELFNTTEETLVGFEKKEMKPN